MDIDAYLIDISAAVTANPAIVDELVGSDSMPESFRQLDAGALRAALVRTFTLFRENLSNDGLLAFGARHYAKGCRVTVQYASALIEAIPVPERPLTWSLNPDQS